MIFWNNVELSAHTVKSLCDSHHTCDEFCGPKKWKISFSGKFQAVIRTCDGYHSQIVRSCAKITMEVRVVQIPGGKRNEKYLQCGPGRQSDGHFRADRTDGGAGVGPVGR